MTDFGFDHGHHHHDKGHHYHEDPMSKINDKRIENEIRFLNESQYAGKFVYSDAK
jgi:hypothetical protein